MAEYALGQSEQALARLINQAKFLQPTTERMLRAAGLGPGMRVLDIGCGARDVRFLAGEMVGADGYVLGIDHAPEPVQMARHRAQIAGLKHVSFATGNETALASEAPFDFVVGRYVLIYQTDPVAFMRSLVARVRVGGTVALQEVDFTRPIEAIPPMAKLERMLNEIVAVMAGTAVNVRTATEMPGIFARANLAPSSGFCERPIGLEGAERFFRWAVSSYAVLQPKIAPESKPIEIDELVGNFLSDVAAMHGCALGSDQWCLWARRK